MKTYTGTYYEIAAPDMSNGLFGKFETIEDAKKHISKEHERAVEAGYNVSETWLIIKTSWNRIFHDNGYFVCENESKYAVCHCDDNGRNI